MNTFIISFTSALIVAIIISLYKKYFEQRPILDLQISTELPAQRVLPNRRHQLTWRYECTLKNISEYTARNISISELSYENLPDIFENKSRLIDIFNRQNHLDKNEELKFELFTSHTTEPDELLNYVIEDGSKIYIPGLKIPHPEKYFRPKRLDGFYLLIKYHNSSRVSFYTLFKKTKTIQKNEYYRLKPK